MKLISITISAWDSPGLKMKKENQIATFSMIEKKNYTNKLNLLYLWSDKTKFYVCFVYLNGHCSILNKNAFIPFNKLKYWIQI